MCCSSACLKLRRGWGDRDRNGARARLRCASVAASPGGFSRNKLAKETPSAFVAFDVLEAEGHDLMGAPQVTRRAALEKLLEAVERPVYLTPVTRDRVIAVDWLTRFEGAGLDGVIAKPESGVYLPGKRAMIKVKHARTAECVVAGFRWHKSGNDAVGSLLLGLYDDSGSASARRCDFVVHDGDAQETCRRACAASQERDR